LTFIDPCPCPHTFPYLIQEHFCRCPPLFVASRLTAVPNGMCCLLCCWTWRGHIVLRCDIPRISSPAMPGRCLVEPAFPPAPATGFLMTWANTFANDSPRLPDPLGVVFFRRCSAELGSAAPVPPAAWPLWPETSQLFSLERGRLVRLLLGQRPGAWERCMPPAAEGDTELQRRAAKGNFGSHRQMNVFIYLLWLRGPRLGPCSSAGGAGERPRLPKKIGWLLPGRPVQCHDVTGFQNWSWLVFWFFPCLCSCALEVPSKWMLIVGAARCCLLKCPRAPRPCSSMA